MTSAAQPSPIPDSYRRVTPSLTVTAEEMTRRTAELFGPAGS